MNDLELDGLLETWEAPAPSPALRETVRQGVPHNPRKRNYGWLAAAASVAAIASLLGIAMLGKGEAQLADGTYIQATRQAEPPVPDEQWKKMGFGASTEGNRREGYWYDKATHTYSGYDLTVKPVGHTEYLLTVQELKKPLYVLVAVRDAGKYRQIALPALPAARVVRAGEPFLIELARVPTGQRVLEKVELSHPSFHSFLEGFAATVHQRHARFAMWLQSLFDNGGGQLRLEAPKVYVNGEVALDWTGGQGPSVAGRGVDLYLPGRGRFILTLHRDGDQRFQPAGTIDGSAMDFQVDGSSYRIVTRGAVAPSGEQTLYVLHEPDFRSEPNKPWLAAGKPGPFE